MPAFTPPWWLRNPHAQTVWGRLTRRRRLVELQREVLTTPDGDELALDHLQSRATARDLGGAERAGEISRVPRRSRSISVAGNGLDRTAPPLHFILMHGLEGSSRSVYIQGLLAVIERHGFGATAINFRSCARDPHRIWRELPNRRPRFYHSGETGDFDFVVNTLARRLPHTTLVAFGASLGGNALLKWLGEHPGQTLIAAAATLSVPYDLGAGSTLLDSTAAGRFYVSRFLASLKKKVARVAREFPETRSYFDPERALRARSFREFDDTATAPLHGFTSAEDYYARSSSIHFLGKITTPTLCLNAEDDPFLPPEVLPRARAAASPSVDFRTTSCGGHVGFVSGALPWRCVYWAEELVVQWLIEHAATADSELAAAQ